MKLPDNKGYTLIELLIYTVIFSISVGVFSGVLLTFTRVGTQTSADAELTQQLSFVQSTIQRLVRDSANIENPAGVASSSLVLRMASSTLDPTIISSDANGIYLKQGTGETLSVTNNQVTVSQFEVIKYENPGGHAIVRVDLALTYNSRNPYQQITRALKIAIGRVSAATFDDSLVPNTDNSFSLGIAGTNRWKNVNISNLLNVGQLATDPVAGSQNGSIYYNTASSTFRGYANGAWANLGGVGWAATSTNDIYNTNSGNVGIGLSNPSYKLDVTGTLRVSATSTFSGNATFSGNVGIGTTSPTYKLQVNGDVSLGSALYTLASTAQGGIDSYNKLMLHADGSDQGTTFTDSETSAKTVTNTEAYDSYTKLMIHMEGSGSSFTDSATSKAITANGDATQTTAQYKFGSKSGVFDGAGDYLSLADSADWAFGTGDFTIDFWIRISANPAATDNLFGQTTDGTHFWQFTLGTDGTLYSNAPGGGIGTLAGTTPVTVNAWNHVAVVRYGSAYSLYLNGVLDVSTTPSSAIDYTGVFSIGAMDISGGSSDYFTGWIDEFRVSKGIARWTSNFTPPPCAYGQACISTSQKEFGTASGYFDGSGSYLSLADSADWYFYDGDFTVDGQFRLADNTIAQYIMGQFVDTSNFWGLYWDAGILRLYGAFSGTVKFHYSSASFSLSANTWYHIAVVRSGSTFYMFLDGVSKSVTETVAFAASADLADTLQIGEYHTGGNYFNGWIDEFRISKGTARWTSNFTPPSAPYDSGIPGAVNVGIGTTSPNYVLDVNGDVNVAAGSNFKVNGTSLPKYSDARFKVGTFTRNTSLPSGTQEITGVGFQPKAVIFFANEHGTWVNSWGMDDGTNVAQIVTIATAAGILYTYTDYSIVAAETGGNWYQGKVSAFGSDGFTINWVKSNTPTGTLTINYIAFR